MKFFATKLSENMSETPEGFLVCHDVSIARIGEQIYGPGETPLEPGPNGKVIITRAEDEVFRPETIASFEGKSITITHPRDFVSPENVKELEKGTVQNVRRGLGEQKDDLVADLLIKDKVAIELVKKGLREVSCGYEAEYTETEPGKGFQSNIIGNHLALVEQGRAGSSYAINDHKGVDKMKLTERVKSIFAKAQDEAIKVIDEGGPEVTAKNKEAEAKGKGYDELVESVKDLGEKVAALSGKKSGDAEGEAAGGQGVKKQKPAEAGGKGLDDDSEDAEENEVEGDIDARVKKLEMMIEKLMKGKASDEESEEEVTDDDEESEESEDDDFEESHMTGDTASRAEILAPGIEKSKDIKVKALKAAYGTKDGKKVIEALTGGKAPDFKTAKTVDTLFIAASEVMKAARTEKVKQTKVTDYQPTLRNDEGMMTAEKMNEINAKFYKK